MKNQILRSLVTSAAFLAAALSFTSTVRAQDGSGPEPLDPAEVRPEPRYVTFGQSREAVISSMKGQPDEKLTADIWVYWGFQRQDLPGHGRFNTLIVFFVDDRVKSYRLVEEKAAREIVAQVKTEAKAGQKYAKK